MIGKPIDSCFYQLHNFTIMNHETGDCILKSYNKIPKENSFIITTAIITTATIFLAQYAYDQYTKNRDKKNQD